MFVSWAQNYEDVYLHRLLHDVAEGFFVDVGAWLPDEHSVSKVLYERGWRGINIEPLPEYADALTAARPRDITLRCVAGAAAGSTTFHRVANTGLSTTNRQFAEEGAASHNEELSTLSVDVVTLDEVWKQHVIGKVADVHVLKIDAEGSEAEVLAGLNLAEHRPWMVIVESNLPDSRVEAFEAWQPTLLKQKYRLTFYDGLNRWYIAEEHNDLINRLAVPINLYDNVVQARWYGEQQKANALELANALLVTKNEDLAATNEDLVRQNEDLVRQNDRLSKAVSRHQLDLADVRSSNSWRFTAPLRLVSKTVGKQIDERIKRRRP